MALIEKKRYEMGTAVAMPIHTSTADPCMNRYVMTTLNAAGITRI
jgi:hypothetical protein